LWPLLKQAWDCAHAMADGIDWPGGFCRHDIGWHALHDFVPPPAGRSAGVFSPH
jgi:hypothetical protein